MSAAVLSLPAHPVYDALARSEVLRLTADTTPDEVRAKLLALREHLTGADPLEVALAREHVLRALRELGYADPGTLLTAALGRPDAARWHGGGADAAPPEPFPTVNFLEGEPAPPPLLHVERLLLAENLNLFAGPKGSGKSPVLLTLAVHVALGTPCFGTLSVNRAGPVVLVVPEDGQDFARTACDAIAHGLGLTPEERALLTQRLVCVPDTIRMDLVRDVRQLRRTMEDFGAVALVLDPMKRLLPGSDENDNSLADLVAGDLLYEIGRGAACTIVAAMHDRKPSRDEADADPSMHSIRGASAWYSAARMIFKVSQNTSARTIRLHCVAANRVRPDEQHHTLRLAITARPNNPAAWTSCALTDVDDGLSTSLTPGVGRPLKESERAALHVLEDEPDTALSWSAWRSRAGLPERTFTRCKMRLQKAGLAESLASGKRAPGGGEIRVYKITPAGRNALLGDPVRIEE